MAGELIQTIEQIQATESIQSYDLPSMKAAIIMCLLSVLKKQRGIKSALDPLTAN